MSALDLFLSFFGVCLAGYTIGLLALIFFIMRENFRAWKQRRNFKKKK